MENKHIFIVLTIVLSAILSQSACSKKKSLDESRILAETDRYYSTLSAQQGMNTAFIAMFDSAGVLLRADRMPTKGLEAISKLLLSESDTNFILTWEPIATEIATSGDLGYTYGTYAIRNKTTGLLLGDGTYATIWKKQPDGIWKAVLDTGNPGLGKKK